MIKLKKPFNYKGGILEAGTIVTLGELEERLIANGVAEKYAPISEQPELDIDRTLDGIKPPGPSLNPSLEEILQAKTKAELLEYVEQAGIDGISDKNKKEEIIAALIDAFKNGLVLDLDAKDAD